MPDYIVDFHSHPLIPSFVKALAKAEGTPSDRATAYGLPLPPWSVEEQLKVMDEHGVGVSLLSVNSLAKALVGAEGRTLARTINEEMAELVARHPTRFGAFAIVPLDDMDAANEEMAHALDVLKLDGVTSATHLSGQYLGEGHFSPWFEEMDRRGVTLFVHPVAPPGFDPKVNRDNVSVVEFMFDTTRMIVSMVLSGAKQRFPKVNLIATHGGGTVPFLAKRIELISQMPWAFRDGPKMSMEEVRAALGSFYFDLTAAVSPTSLNAIRDLLPAEQLLMGFDFPFMPPQTIEPAVESFTAYGGFGAEEKQKIICGNAERLFPRLAATIV